MKNAEVENFRLKKLKTPSLQYAKNFKATEKT